ncbi:TetR/AcrR family transcriptional regulator [Streptoalloteichus hindustanus]|uniref:Transcriptional regulator, TetR family n=1 Tax=Streptoalloteichus hindustanus TaxID=2017 RepID=A0A1M5MSW1_STRHI|nr:TetR/AcrR family transcriptional regulator [Streptoalloteichus hindustanus]SHG80351.1 transcriptional regulator, TetR family [Streptoalloteichus hindustanus]
MDESRRERKKRQTRRLLAETALRLFLEQGYEQTTVAQIAAAADVATKTFFNHFPSKDDVLFVDHRERVETALAVIADRREGESVADLLTRAYEVLLAEFRAGGVGRDDTSLFGAYPELIKSVPSLQAKALQVSFAMQKEIAGALCAAYPDKLDPVSAAAAVGSLVGATQAAAMTSLELGQNDAQFWAAMRCGVDVALRGLDRY